MLMWKPNTTWPEGRPLAAKVISEWICKELANKHVKYIEYPGVAYNIYIASACAYFYGMESERSIDNISDKIVVCTCDGSNFHLSITDPNLYTKLMSIINEHYREQYIAIMMEAIKKELADI